MHGLRRLASGGTPARQAPVGWRWGSAPSPSFSKICLVWASTVRSVTNRRLAMARFDRPSATRARASRSRSLSAESGSSRRRRPTRRDTIVVDHAFAFGGPVERVHQDGGVEHPLLQEVANSFGVVRD